MHTATLNPDATRVRSTQFSKDRSSATSGRLGRHMATDADPTYRLYLKDIGDSKLLSPEEEVELAARVQRGDAEARERMIKSNLRLVVKIAREYSNYGLSLLDLINEGNMGLMKAVERFDPTKGGKLSTYSAWWIKQSIKRALANQGKTIRLPVHMVDKISRMRRANAELREELGRDATSEELANRLEITPARLQEMIDASATPASLNAPMSDENGAAEFADIVPDENAKNPYLNLEESNIRETLQNMLSRIPERDAQVIQYRFGLIDGRPRTLEEVGELIGITRERVRQIQNHSLERLRRMVDLAETVHA